MHDNADTVVGWGGGHYCNDCGKYYYMLMTDWHSPNCQLIKATHFLSS